LDEEFEIIIVYNDNKNNMPQDSEVMRVELKDTSYALIGPPLVRGISLFSA
jgi:hypothetical protein